MKPMKIRKPNLLLFAALTLLCFSCSANDHKAQPVTQPYGMKALPYTTAVEVVWPAQEGTSRYEVQYTEGTDFTAATAREVTGEKLLVEGLKPDTEYSVRVRAAAGSDWTDWSVTKTVTTYSLEISVGTFNLLGATYTFKGPWDVRKGPAGRLILNDAFFPDILGTQETANEQQMNDMIAMLREHYDYRAGEHETMSAHLVFWKRERFELVEAEDVDMMGDNYPGKYLTSRYANYVRLREKATGNEILVYDIHPRAGNDVETQKLREMTAKGLATAALRKARETNLPVIITGDMNNYPTTMIEGVAGTPLTLTSKGFLDTYAMTENRTNGDFSTHCSQENVAEDGSLTVGRNGTKRIDYIYAYPYERAAASDYAIVIDFADDTHTSARVPMPSDHLPVRTTLHFRY
ncbi:MAG: endonuclease/exonuclease/phosphatase family protein [Alistipes sp.]|uniref:endonuclease/exonuclease/phosphatase family protein n=1 Tax=Alistipes sp. TaxID=1872444 RepID=UPI001DD52455|nr:endonuclease/exonuclease/phosphatase family protein [Alistipes sp.]MBS5019076.1 endonuclease/exonuclease/phosphatase family protein [Alistipes sp.]